MVLSDSSETDSDDDDSALFRPVFSRHREADVPPASATTESNAEDDGTEAAGADANNDDGDTSTEAEEERVSGGASSKVLSGGAFGATSSGGDEAGKSKGGRAKMQTAMTMRRRLIIDDDDTSSSEEEVDCDDDDNVADDDDNSCKNSDAADITTNASETTDDLTLPLGTPGILHPRHAQHDQSRRYRGSKGGAERTISNDANCAVDDNACTNRGLIAALESLALSPVVPNGVVGTPLIGTARTTIGADDSGTTTTPATPAATPAAPPGGGPLDASIAAAKANATTSAALEDSNQNDDVDYDIYDTLADTDDAIGEGQNDEVTTPVPVQMPAAELDDTATTNCNGAKSSNSMVQTPAQRRLDNMRRRFNGGDNTNKRTPLRLEDLNYESDHYGDDEYDDSDVEKDRDEEDYEETESEADDDIFQTSYYVPSGRKQKKAAASAGGSGGNGRNEDVMTKLREPVQLLVDTDDEGDDDAKSKASSSSSSGITISDDERVIGNAGTDEIDNLFRDGLKISSSPTTPGDDDDDSSKSTSSEAVPALVLSPLEPSPDRVDMTSLGDEDSKTSSDEPADSAWTHDAETDEYYLSSGGVTGHTWPNLRLPIELYRRLYPHQKVGVQWMASMHRGGVGGILGDDMGLGKTFQTLTYLGGLMRTRTIRNALIICPVSVIRTWEREGATILRQSCVPRVNICVVSSDMKKHRRTHVLQDALHCSKKRPHLVITSYGLVSNSPLDFVSQEQSIDVGGAWDYVVVDEGHKMKNPNTQVSKACRRICKGRSGDDSKTRRLLLTGTPIQNNLKELWALFDFATSSRLLGPLRRFQNSFGDPIEAGRMKNATEWTIRTAEKANKELQAKLRPHFLQRLKSSEFKEMLPTKRELVVFTHLSEKQRTMYDQFLAGGMVASILTGETASPLEAITWLKKLCGHPYLVDKTGHSSICDLGRKRLVEDSAKLHVLHDLLLRLNQSGHRTLIFSQSTKMLDIIQRVMSQKLNISRIDGQTREKDRQRSVDAFNSDGSSIDCMLLSTKAAGIGLTLTGADRAVIFDPSWNPADDSQAVDRCFRIGQTKNVTVYRFITAGSVEEAMYRKVVHKDGIRQTVIGAGGSATERHFDKDDLRKIFTLGPPGECEMLSMIKRKAGSTNDAVGASGKPSFLESHPGVVGLSSHDKLYTNSVIEIDNEPETPFAGTPLRKQSKAMGRAQRALAANSNTRTKLDFGGIIDENSPAPNDPIDLSNDRKPLARISNKDGEQEKKRSADPFEKKTSSAALDINIALSDADAMLEAGRGEDAMSQLLDLLESGTVNGPGKISMHKKIATTATQLGWL